MRRLLISFTIGTLILSGCGSRQKGDTLDGLWQAQIKFPQLTMRLVLHFETTDSDGLHGIVTSPDAGDGEFPMSELKLDGDEITFSVNEIRASFKGEVTDSTIVGSLIFGPQEQQVTFSRIDEIARSSRPQTPKPPFPYRAENIRFTAKDVILAGTLTMPEGEGPFDAVLLLQGVGGHDRDYTMQDHKPFLVISDYLTRQGLAVLRYDERSVGESSGDPSRSTTADFAEDARFAVGFLRDRNDIGNIYLIGHSEGGTVATMLAAKGDVEKAVVLSAPGLSGVDYNVQFERSMAAAAGVPEAQIEKRTAFQRRVLNLVTSAMDDQALSDTLRRLYISDYPELPPERIEAGLRRFTSPWFRYSAGYDPAPTISAIEVPTLFIFTEMDRHVPPVGNMEAVERAAEGHVNIKLMLLPGLNHFYQHSETGSPSEYGEIEETFSTDALKLIAHWLKE